MYRESSWRVLSGGISADLDVKLMWVNHCDGWSVTSLLCLLKAMNISPYSNISICPLSSNYFFLLIYQIWRSLRLIADVGFHQRNISRQEILKKFQQYTWDTSDTVEKELTRYQGKHYN